MRLSPELINQHHSFYDRSEATRPLLDFFVGGLFPLAQFRDGLSDGLLAPEAVVPEAFEDYHRILGAQVPVRGELIETLFPFIPIPWMEAIIGCPVRVSLDTCSIGAEPFLEDLSELDRVEEAALDPENPWRLKLLEYQHFLVETFGGEKPVGLPIMRGPMDMIGAMLGGERTVFGFYDHPREMERLLRICADAWLQTARAQFEVIPPFQGGYFNYRQVHLSEPSPVLQEDNVAMLSPSLYREFVLPQDERILVAFPHALFHTHSSSAHILLDDLLACPLVKSVDSCWDLPPFGPPVQKLIPSYHRIQEAGKSLYVVAVGCPAEEDLLLLRDLDPRGLCIFFDALDQTTGRQIAQRFERAWEVELEGK
jgi:hypothetical protein